MIAIIILAVVFLLIAVRQAVRIRLKIWQIMLLGAVGVLVSLQISPSDAIHSIDIDVMLFLFGMFIVGKALEESGYLSGVTDWFFRKVRNPDILLPLIIFSMGLLSAFFMNDTVAIIGTPVMLLLSRRSGLPASLLLLALAFAVTTGSVMSPIGNPQNLLIAVHGDIPNPFVTFLRYLFVPTILNLAIVYLVLRVVYRKHFSLRIPVSTPQEIQVDKNLGNVVKLSLSIMGIMIAVKIVLAFTATGIDFKLTWIALVSALPVLLFSKRRLEIIRKIDWTTLVFFAALFILMAAVWNSGYFQRMTDSLQLDMTSQSTILTISVLLSQLISNVPLVALYLPVLTKLGGSTAAMMALATGSTIAGNLTILGAASNVIIIQNAEKNKGITITFLEFIRAGIPLTLLNCVVYWLFLEIQFTSG